MNISEFRNEAKNFDRAYLDSVRVGNNVEPEQNFRAVCNNSTRKTIAMVSDGYNLVQHEDMSNSVCDALQNLNIDAEVSKVGNAGNRIYVDITFPKSKLYVNVGEEFVAGIRLVNSYNKQTGIMVLPHIMRLACKNGMTISVGWVKEFNVHHTEKLAQNFAGVIEQMLKDMISGNEKLKAMVNDCIGDSIEWALMDKIIAKLVDGRSKHIENITNLLKQKYAINGKIPTRWDCYNSFSDYATNGEQIKPNVEYWLQSRAQKILMTPLIQLVPAEKKGE